MPGPSCGSFSASTSSITSTTTANSGWVVDLQEWREQPERYGDIRLPGWLPEIPQAWLVVPLLDGGELIGLIFLAKPLATVRLDWEVMDLLKTATSQAAAYVGQLEANMALTEARQFEGFHRLSAYILHDLKNIIAQQSIITKNAAKHKHNPAFVDDVVAVMEHSVTKMSRLMNLLKSGLSENRPRPVRLDRLLESVMEELAVYEPTPSLEARAADVELIVDPDRLRTALRNIVQNAQQATTREGRVVVSVEKTEGHIRISVEDDGMGMAPEFIQERLFQPFYTTKGDVGMGVGAYESREYIRSLGGDIQVQSQPGSGSVFRIVLPCPEAEQEHVA
jgi:putative PEP-CTERM system histidine kinase